ncbi:hypothetical protein Tco_1241681, partial [Tanacetum coccineum]
TNDGVAASFQRSQIHHHMLMLRLQRHTISIKIQRIKKAQVLKTKTSANSDINDNSSEIKLWGRLLESMLVKTQDRKVAKMLKTNKDKDLKILEQKTKSKDNDKGSRSNITKHEGTSLQQDKDQNKDSRTKRQSILNKSKEVRFKDLASGEKFKQVQRIKNKAKTNHTPAQLELGRPFVILPETSQVRFWLRPVLAISTSAPRGCHMVAKWYEVAADMSVRGGRLTWQVRGRLANQEVTHRHNDVIWQAVKRWIQGF